MSDSTPPEDFSDSQDENPYESPQGDATDPWPAEAMGGAEGNYRTVPVDSPNTPAGIPYIVGNEAAERFSFYGMKSILVVFMVHHLRNAAGELAPMNEHDAQSIYHFFTSAVYFLPLAGAILSDWLLGKYRTIMFLSVVYCLGHLALAVDETLWGMSIGLTLIAIGSGGIKPCVSAHVGDQFGRRNQHLINKVFAWYYFAINLGAFLSTALTPLLLDWYGPAWAFGVPGALMLLATIVFWMGRHEFVHVPAGGSDFIRETFSPEGLKALLSLSLFFLLLAPFWALFDQTGSSWVLQAEKMNRHIGLFDFELKAAQLQAINPILILVFIPIFSYGVYPAINRYFPLTPLRKISIGMFLTTISFAICAVVQGWIDQSHEPSILWQVLAYAVLTASEVFVSITALEFSYTQSPKKMKSLVMACFMLSISVGNLFTSAVNYFIQRPDGTVILEGPAYFWFFAGIMLVTAFLFIPVAMFYRGKTYIQGDSS